MLNLKHLLIIFFIGFLLSFFSGLIGNVGVGLSFIRAIISGIVFIGLALGAVTVYNKFLTVSSAVETSADENEVQNQNGQVVDVVIDDDLPDSATAPSFNLATIARQEDTFTDSGSETFSQPLAESQEAPTFQSGSLDSLTSTSVAPSEYVENTNDNATEQAPVQSPEPRPTSATSVSTELLTDDGGSELGVLPDIESLSVDEESDTSSAADELIQDSVFAETGEVKPSLPPVATSEMGDAKEIAAAIRTALVKDT